MDLVWHTSTWTIFRDIYFLTKAGILTIFVELSLLMSTYRGNRLARVYKLINKHMHLKWRAL
jgi:hypothetical protein